MHNHTLRAHDENLPQIPECEVGVLFIHGIGAQRRGQTLAEFGAPIYRWIEDRFERLDRRWREVIHGHPEQSLLETWRSRTEEWATDGFHRGETADWEKFNQALVSAQSLAPLSRALRRRVWEAS